MYATAAPIPHVFMVVGGRPLDASRDGTDASDRAQNGPRWRILIAFPGSARWSVRTIHPVCSPESSLSVRNGPAAGGQRYLRRRC